MVDASEEKEREARIAELKRQIAAGSYETPEKIEAALDAFLDDHQRGEVRPGKDRAPVPGRPK